MNALEGSLEKRQVSVDIRSERTMSLHPVMHKKAVFQTAECRDPQKEAKYRKYPRPLRALS